MIGTHLQSYITISVRKFQAVFYGRKKGQIFSILHALGYPDKYIMARGGWKSTNVLNRVYKHVLREQQKDFDAIAIKHFEKSFFKSV